MSTFAEYSGGLGRIDPPGAAAVAGRFEPEDGNQNS